MTTFDEEPTDFSLEVGRRLRAIRRARRMSLDEVERRSGGRWSASAIGAYERGFRNLSLPRLRELAEFYEVPMGALLGEESKGDTSVRTGRLVVDIDAIAKIEEAEPAFRYLQSIMMERRDFEGAALAVRGDDIRALAAIMQITEAELYGKLEDWDALLEAPRE
ncbi:MAG: helix-turn-helix domain-containing protein [Acidimicrobiales bacterium]